MPHSKDFIEGYRRAAYDLGQEGDDRGANWSDAYKYLNDRANGLKPKEIGTFQGIKIVADPSIAAGLIEFHHADGRVDTFSAPKS